MDRLDLFLVGALIFKGLTGVKEKASVEDIVTEAKFIAKNLLKAKRQLEDEQ